MNKAVIKRIILEKQDEITRLKILDRGMTFESRMSYVIIGPRRAGKSYMLYRDIQNNISRGTVTARGILYINFEDERIASMKKEELGLVLDAYLEMFDTHPLVYLDEIQNIAGWEKFARRLADSKYRVMITGSNAKMLSREISTVLGGRYIPREVFPFSFQEKLLYDGIKPEGGSWEYDSNFLRKISKEYLEYFNWGGFPETFGIENKREWLNSLYQKVLMGDILERNAIRNAGVFRLLVRKLADSVMQPCSLKRLQNILSSTGESISLPVLKDYLTYLEDAYLTFSISNLASPITEQETIKKRYFIDHGILALFLLDGETKMLENLVAAHLSRRFRNTNEETRLYYYSRNIEIDFCIPEIKQAIQVSYSLEKDETFTREMNALKKFLAFRPEYSGTIITNDMEDCIRTEYGEIKVIPIWKWLLS